ncbi:MAG: hypothetical protein JXO72_16425 [Vicinamibacteria bacterium]|nr:hypothetical protein [Vicinamibacteria bacterium]
MSGFMVRLQDGSEIGPLDPVMLRSWYEQGLIDDGSLVMPAGSKRWTKLSEAINVSGWIGGGAPQARGGRKRVASRRGRVAKAQEPMRGFETPERAHNVNLRMVFAAFVLTAAAGMTGYWAYSPARQLSALNDVPWLQAALVFLALALGLYPSWEWGRKAARVALLMVFVAMFPLAGVVWAAKRPYEVLLVLAGAASMSIGLVGLLVREATSIWKVVATAFVAVIGLAGMILFGFVPEGAGERSLRDWIAVTQEYSDSMTGLHVSPSRGWVILSADQAVLEIPPETLVSLARQDGGGFAYLATEKIRVVSTLDEYLERAFTFRRMRRPAIKEQERSSVDVCDLPGRRVIAIWSEEDKSYYDVTTVWRDGSTHFTLAAWVVGEPERPREALRSLDALIGGVACSGQSARQLRDAVARATEELPFLSPETAETLMSMSDAEVLEPDEVFRRAQKLAASGIPRLEKTEIAEFRGLNDAMYASIPRRQRNQIARYLEKLRRGELSAAKEDREMRSLLKQATLSLGAEKRARLQALYQKAILIAARQAD